MKYEIGFGLGFGSGLRSQSGVQVKLFPKFSCYFFFLAKQVTMTAHDYLILKTENIFGIKKEMFYLTTHSTHFIYG